MFIGEKENRTIIEDGPSHATKLQSNFWHKSVDTEEHESRHYYLPNAEIASFHHF